MKLKYIDPIFLCEGGIIALGDANLLLALQELRKKGNAGDINAMKRLIMIFTHIIEQATDARDYDTAMAAKEEGQYWLNRIKVTEDRINREAAIERLNSINTKISDAIQPCSTCAFMNTSHCNYFGQRKPSSVLYTGCGRHS